MTLSRKGFQRNTEISHLMSLNLEIYSPKIREHNSASSSATNFSLHLGLATHAKEPSIY